MAGTSLRKHDKKATRCYLTLLSFSRGKQSELYLQRAQALQIAQKTSDPEELVPCTLCTWLTGAADATAKQKQALKVIPALVKVRDQGKGQ